MMTKLAEEDYLVKHFFINEQLLICVKCRDCPTSCTSKLRGGALMFQLAEGFRK